MASRAPCTLLPLIALLTHCSAAGKEFCPRTAIPSGIKMAAIGAQVGLDCGPGGAEGPEWRFNGKALTPSHRHAVNGSRLTLGPAQTKDTGDYTCYRNGTVAVGIRLLVGVKPRTPVPFCFLKSFMSPIRCEWRSKELNRLTQCTLSYRVSLQSPSGLRNCTFYTGKQVCMCKMPHSEGEYEHFYVALAISNGIGCASSKERMLTFDDLLKSDPPESLKVKSVQKAAHKLNVTWFYPKTWQRGFYALKFEISYGFQQGEPFKTLTILETNFLIADALPGKNYTVQVRAKEEFNHGSWSDWSPQAFGVPWADPRKNMIPEDDVEGLPSTPIESVDNATEGNPPPVQESHDPEGKIFTQYVAWLAVMCFLSVTSLFIIIVIRYRKKWRDKSDEKGKDQSCPEYLPVQLLTVSETQGSPAVGFEPMAETPLQETPLQETPGDLPREHAGTPVSPEDPSHFDVINLGYFYIPE